ncbi:hypothetical protein TKK_0012303 [Trichogramma kaykai]
MDPENTFSIASCPTLDMIDEINKLYIKELVKKKILKEDPFKNCEDDVQNEFDGKMDIQVSDLDLPMLELHSQGVFEDSIPTIDIFSNVHEKKTGSVSSYNSSVVTVSSGVKQVQRDPVYIKGMQVACFRCLKRSNNCRFCEWCSQSFPKNIYLKPAAVEPKIDDHLKINMNDNHGARILSEPVLALPSITFDNGLYDDVSYYLLDIESTKGSLTIGNYNAPKHPIFTDHHFYLYSNDYSSLISPEWIFGDVIDNFGKMNSTKSWNATSIITEVSRAIMSLGADNTDVKWPMHKLSRNQIKRYIFLPYLEADHWTLYVVDTLEEKVMHLDPKKFERTRKEFSNRTKTAHKNFALYLKRCNDRGGNFLSKIKWKISPFPEEYPLQKDNVHCGAFVMHFMDVIGSNGHFDR